MKKNVKINSKLIVNQETIRRLSELDMRAVNGGLKSGIFTCQGCGTTEGPECG